MQRMRSWKMWMNDDVINILFVILPFAFSLSIMPLLFIIGCVGMLFVRLFNITDMLTYKEY